MFVFNYAHAFAISSLSDSSFGITAPLNSVGSLIAEEVEEVEDEAAATAEEAEGVAGVAEEEGPSNDPEIRMISDHRTRKREVMVVSFLVHFSSFFLSLLIQR